MIRTEERLTQKQALEIYRELLLPRLIEERMLKLLRQNRISKWFSGIGQEAISVGVGITMETDDYILPMHRNLGVFTTRRVPLYELFCQLLGRADGFTGGRDRSFHFGSPEHNIFGMISHLGSTMPVADGIALAQKLNNSGQIAVSFCGDGATSEGDFHEALNLAGVWKLPVIFLIENNGYGLSTPVSDQSACEKFADKAAGYGLKSVRIDGNNIFAVRKALKRARELAVSGEPVLIEAVTFRLRGHEEASGTFYVPDKEFEEWHEWDPVHRYEDWLVDQNFLAGQDEIDEIRLEIRAHFKEELNRALKAEEPVYNEKEQVELAALSPQPKITVKRSRSGNGKATEKRFIDALRHSLKQAFEEDETCLIMGQDIAEYGGVFKVTEDFVELFGKERVRNTPIIESGAIGAAIGLAIEGFKPVVEMQFADFISCGFNQIVNNLAKSRYRWTPDLNVTIRAPHGAGVGAGPFHSQSPEGWFMQIPGLRILIPSNVEDAQNMLYTAVFDPNPVLFFEHKKLYRSIRSETADHCRIIDIESANVVRSGTDATIITYGLGVHWALEEAEIRSNEGVELEVIDLRSLAPIDWNTVLDSVRKTSRALLLQEPSEIMGPMSELSSVITERAFEHLDAPVMRCSSLNTPIPYSKELEAGYLASHRFKERLNQLLEY